MGKKLTLIITMFFATNVQAQTVHIDWFRFEGSRLRMGLQCLCGTYKMTASHFEPKKRPKRRRLAFAYGFTECTGTQHLHQYEGYGGQDRSVTFVGCGRFWYMTYRGRTYAKVTRVL
jgi:hypothetical protein